MIDHLITLEITPGLSAFGIEAWDGPNPVSGTFEGYRVDVIPVTVINVEAEPGTDENDPGTPAVTAPGFWFCVRSDARLDLPWPFVTITDSDRAARGEPFVLAIGDGWEWHHLTGRVWPVWSGTDYPFGPDMGPDTLVVE
ncbi:hypothetical protein [Pannonibacter sp. P2PFMT1]|uniref:hypothetical protein n=1 Tax=Pannonibacter sp. P2PFMT1 TaxID=2003582 RepID=UPI001647E340|nr:hypothetical protein [Pannonibacter sp. P2PFMT1]